MYLIIGKNATISTIFSIRQEVFLKCIYSPTVIFSKYNDVVFLLCWFTPGQIESTQFTAIITVFYSHYYATLYYRAIHQECS